jgi:antitoxin component of MazEF toxin-antitoxin module
MMQTVKIRRVGNSNVISLPRGLEPQGYTEGAAVAVVPLRSGRILLVPADQIDAYIDEIGQRIVKEDREALDKLAAYDHGEVQIATQ